MANVPCSAQGGYGTPRCLRIAAVVTFDVASLAFNLPARLWLSWNLTTQVTVQNFMMSSCLSFLSDQHCLVAPVASAARQDVSGRAQTFQALGNCKRLLCGTFGRHDEINLAIKDVKQGDLLRQAFASVRGI